MTAGTAAAQAPAGEAGFWWISDVTFRRWLCRDSGEAIEVLALPLAHADAFERDESIPKSAGLLFGLMWLRNQKRGDTL